MFIVQQYTLVTTLVHDFSIQSEDKMMVEGIQSGSQGVNPQQDAQSQVEQAIRQKQQVHNNAHGGQQDYYEKEKLRKLFQKVELSMGDRLSDDDGEDQGIKDGLNQMLNSHVRDSINTLKDQYGISDDQLDHVHDIVDTDHTLAAQGDIVLSGGIAVLYLFMNLLSDLAQYKYLEMQEKAKVSRDAQNMANEVNELIAKVSKQGDSGSATLPADVIRYMEENGIKIDDKSIDDYLGLKGGVSTKIGITGVTLNGTKFSDSAHVGVYIIGHTYTVFYNGKRVPLNPDQYKIVNGKITATIDGKDIGVKSGKMVITGNVRTDVGRKLNKGELTAVKSALENTSNRASDFVSQSQLQLQKIMQTYNVTVSLINSMQTLLEEMNKSIAQNVR